MARYRVDCIRKRGSHLNPHERIEGLGGQYPQNWYALEDQIIGWIDSSTHTFFTSVDGREAEVIVAYHGNRKYLKTTADGFEPNNLLRLPECPATWKVGT